MFDFNYSTTTASPWATGWYQLVLSKVEMPEPNCVKLWWEARNARTGATKRVCDFIDASKAAWKVKSLCYALGLADEFEQKMFHPMEHLEPGAAIWGELKGSKPGTSYMSVLHYARQQPTGQSRGRGPRSSGYFSPRSDNDLMD